MGFEFKPLTLLGKPDRIFAGSQFPKPFEFNAEVVEVFDDMVSRSVPLYHDVIETLRFWVHHHYTPATKIYDLGCSTGTTFASLLRGATQPLHLVGIDNSESMITKAQEKLNASTSSHKIELLCQDITATNIENASVVIMNYTLQFIPVKDRLTILKKIKDGLCDGGFLFLSEKVRSENPLYQEMATRIYEDFKELQGYSRDEIARKKEALDQVLIPLSEKEQMQLLYDAGFRHCDITMKWNNFTTFVAM